MVRPAKDGVREGNCKTTYKGRLWCYIEEIDGNVYCKDATKSRKWVATYDKIYFLFFLQLLQTLKNQNILSSSYSGTYWSYDACFTPARTDQACIIDFGQLYLLTRLHILLVQFDIFLTQLYISVAHTDYFILNQPALPTCSRRGKNEVRYVLRIGPEGGRVFFIILYQSYEHFKYQTNRGRWNLFLICLQFLFLYLE